MLAVERAREALAVCERLSAGRVEEWPRTAIGHATRAAGAPWHGSRYRLRCGVCTLYHTHPLDPGRAFPRFVFILCKSKLCVCALSLPQARRQRALKAVCNGRDDPVATATVAFAFFLTGLTVFIYTEVIHPLVMWS